MFFEAYHQPTYLEGKLDRECSMSVNPKSQPVVRLRLNWEDEMNRYEDKIESD
ncbi:hypothetical protein HMPREF0204_13782 [Chryseobacterium gleum ATCC 35910]|uniref:Uncharacterized protein n=1 Tax=Chryseobacterium gleum ATCC 35910 TaxID=525257 RepID=A0ABP2ITA3_CHRGE|nr:hypothetical protein HMPREF0204_13782 [Chryseobacterium gleum ATCC 35910]